MRIRREQLGLVASWVAEQVGISRQYYCNLEKGRRPVPSALKEPLAKVLQTSVTVLWPEDNHQVDLYRLGPRERRLVEALLDRVELPGEFWDAAERLLEGRKGRE